jgi:hypothetical protein
MSIAAASVLSEHLIGVTKSRLAEFKRGMYDAGNFLLSWALPFAGPSMHQTTIRIPVTLAFVGSATHSGGAVQSTVRDDAQLVTALKELPRLMTALEHRS